MKLSLPKRVAVVEVGPRDGLQNEAIAVPTSTKIKLIDRLSETGLTAIESTAFVSAKQVPQLSDAETVMRELRRRPGVAYPVLVPNLRGLERALAADARDIAVFTGASQTFTQENIHCSIEESLKRFERVVAEAKDHGVRVRAYISCALGCPYEGAVDTAVVVALAAKLHAMGCAEIAISDTIGVGTPLQARALVAQVAHQMPLDTLAVHFHDTRGQALANIFACLEYGVSIVDASVAGLGGCPFAPGASGNVATEDVVYMLHGMEIETGIDLPKLIKTGRFISSLLGRENTSRIGQVRMGNAA